MSDKYSIEDIINFSATENPLSVKNAVDSLMLSKVHAAIEAKKTEVAKSLFGGSIDDEDEEFDEEDFDDEEDVEFDEEDFDDEDFDISDEDLDDLFNDLDELEYDEEISDSEEE